jgi:hypothetical protein
MPIRTRKNKRRRSVNVTSGAISVFRRGVEMLKHEHDPYELRDVKIALADALGRSKFRACPLDAQPHSLIGGDREPLDDVLKLRAQLLKQISAPIPQPQDKHDSHNRRGRRAGNGPIAPVSGLNGNDAS